MKKALLIVLLLLPTWSTFSEITPSGSPDGHWDSFATSEDCGSGNLCAEWYEPDSVRHLTLCCISQSNLFSTAYGACIREVERGPRGNML